MVGFLGHMEDLFLVVQEVFILFSMMSVSVYIPTNSAVQCSVMPVTIYILSTSSPAFIICRFFDNGHSDWCEVEAFSCNDSHLKGLYTHTCDLDSCL